LSVLLSFDAHCVSAARFGRAAEGREAAAAAAAARDRPLVSNDGRRMIPFLSNSFKQQVTGAKS
jgi:hypothetical protein